MTHILPPQKPGQRSNGPSPTARSSREAAGRVPGSLAAARAPRSVPSSNATYGVSSGVKAHPTTLVKQASRAEAAVADETLADDLSEPADAADVVESNRDADSDDAEVDAAPLSEFALPPSLAETYRLKGPVGSGAFGTVWRATHIDSGLEVAIKVIERKKQLVEDFRLELNEAEILKALNHPNIVRLTELAADPSGTAAYLIMELVNGGHLQAQLDEHGAYADADASEIFRQMANAIAYLHERNITHRSALRRAPARAPCGRAHARTAAHAHTSRTRSPLACARVRRDIKPENILFTQPGALTVKLTDFGMSTMKGGRLTTRCGTPSYCGTSRTSTMRLDGMPCSKSPRILAPRTDGQTRQQESETVARRVWTDGRTEQTDTEIGQHTLRRPSAVGTLLAHREAGTRQTAGACSGPSHHIEAPALPAALARTLSPTAL